MWTITELTKNDDDDDDDDEGASDSWSEVIEDYWGSSGVSFSNSFVLLSIISPYV